MTYATLAEMITRFGEPELVQRTDRAEGVAVDMTVLNRKFADADAEIDSYLAVRYALPLASTPVLLVSLAADITRYRLYDDGVPETVRQRYLDAVSLLKRLSSGDVLLVGHAAAAVAGVDTASHEFSPRQITDETTRGFA